MPRIKQVSAQGRALLEWRKVVARDKGVGRDEVLLFNECRV